MPQAESDTRDITSRGASYTTCHYHTPRRAVCKAVTVTVPNAAWRECKGEADVRHDQNQDCPVELDKAFQYAVSLAWGDFKGTNSQAIRVEYLCESAAALVHLSVWSVTAGGYHNLVCDYWMRTSSSHPSGIRFGQGYYSDGLAQTLGFIMKNQGQFTRAPDACCHGMVLIYPPDADDRKEAAALMRVVVQALNGEGGAGEAPEPPEDHRQDEQAWSRMDDEGYPHERSAILPEAPGSSRIGESFT